MHIKKFAFSPKNVPLKNLPFSKNLPFPPKKFAFSKKFALSQKCLPFSKKKLPFLQIFCPFPKKNLPFKIFALSPPPPKKNNAHSPKKSILPDYEKTTKRKIPSICGRKSNQSLPCVSQPASLSRTLSRTWALMMGEYVTRVISHHLEWMVREAEWRGISHQPSPTNRDVSCLLMSSLLSPPVVCVCVCGVVCVCVGSCVYMCICVYVCVSVISISVYYGERFCFLSLMFACVHMCVRASMQAYICYRNVT